MSTATANLGLIKPELTDTADITAFNDNWDTLDEILSGGGDIPTKSTVVDATLLAASWSNGLYTWSNANITSVNQIIELVQGYPITTEQVEALQGANILHESQAVGSITFRAYGEVPTIDIPVKFVIRGDV